MPERTEHGRHRHEHGDRPTQEAFRDRQQPKEVYLDIETGNRVYVGVNGRTHIFTPDGKHHTSFWTTRQGRFNRVMEGKWNRQKSSGEG